MNISNSKYDSSSIQIKADLNNVIKSQLAPLNK
jgi:hypothetical protein